MSDIQAATHSDSARSTQVIAALGRRRYRPWTAAALVAAVLIGLTGQTRDTRAAGALAFGRDGSARWASGGAWNYGTSGDAEAAALRNCRARGPGCSVVTVVKGACVALAVQNAGNGYRWQVNPSLATARQQALSGCANFGRACSIKTSFCDGAPSAPTEPPPLLTPTTTKPITPATTGSLSACRRFPNLC
jgi:hypothetical protein